MFDNIGTAIVQAVGFFGVFGFFVYRLITDKDSNSSIEIKNKINPTNPVSEKKGLFGRKKAKEEQIELPKKKGWFKR
tara:strand:+ start:848 stop:1078 length:231 start_codon:yes stop_codon:yes gene_type:complete